MFSKILKQIGNLFGEDIPPPEPGDPLDFESGPFLDCAISWVYTFKKLIIPRDYRNGIGNVRCVYICDKRNKNKHCKT